MDKRVVFQKIESLRRCVGRIKEKTPDNPTPLETDFDVQDIISVNLERAVQQCIDIASHILADFDDVSGQSAASLFADLEAKQWVGKTVGQRLSRAVGFRNLLVHRYASIDWQRVYETLQSDIEIFAQFARDVSAKIEE